MVSREKADADHGALVAVRAARRLDGEGRPEWTAGSGIWEQIREGRGQELAALSEPELAVAVGEEAEVADALESRGESVEEKAADELLGGERHAAGFVLVFVAVVLPLERDFTVVHRLEAIVGDGGTVGITAEVSERLLGSAERRFGVDDPVASAQGGEVSPEGGWSFEGFDFAGKLEFSLIESLFEGLEKEVAEEARQHGDREKEAGPAADPVLVVRAEAAAGNDAVDMRMVEQVLSPGVEDSEEADLGAEVP